MNINIISKYIDIVDENKEDFIGRCPLCGDSSNPHHGHLYIMKNTGVYHCFRCNETGHVNNLLLREYDLESSDRNFLLSEQIKNKNKKLNYNPIDNSSDILDKENDLMNILTNKDFNLFFSNDDKIKEKYNKVFDLYWKFINKRLKGLDKYQKRELIQKQIIIPFYNIKPQYYNLYKPGILTNRLFFKHMNKVYSSRQVDNVKELLTKSKQYEKYKFDKSKYVFYIPKNYNNSYPFLMKDKDMLNVKNIWLVEGQFDVIKLYYFLQDTEEDYIVMSTNNRGITKNQRKIITNIIKTNKRNFNKIVWIPDKDVIQDKDFVQYNIDTLNIEINNEVKDINKYNFLIGKMKDNSIFKDIGDFTIKEDLKNIKIFTSKEFKFNDLLTKFNIK